MNTGHTPKKPKFEPSPNPKGSKKVVKALLATGGALTVGTLGITASNILANATNYTDNNVTMSPDNILTTKDSFIKKLVSTTSEKKKKPVSNLYSFVPKFNKKTVVVAKPAGMWESRTQGKVSAFTLNDPPVSLEGKPTITYQNVGKYKGEIVDLEISIDNWDDEPYLKNKSEKLISYSKKSIAMFTSGYRMVVQNWHFKNHDTGEKVQIDGLYYTFADLDAMQFLRFGSTTTRNIDEIIVSDDTEVEAEYANERLAIGHTSDKEDTETEDVKRRATVLFSSVNSISFGWGKDYKRAQMNSDYKYPEEKHSRIGGNMFMYTGQKLAPSELEKPEKFVHTLKDGDTPESSHNIKGKSNTLKTQDQLYVYRITQHVPDESSDFYYNSFSISDSLPLGIVPLKDTVSIYDDNGELDADEYKVSWTGGTGEDTAKEFTFTPKTLKDSSFYGKTYDISFNVKIAYPTVISKLYEKTNSNYSEIPNTARSMKNGALLNSNKVTTSVKKLEDSAITKYNVRANGAKTTGKVHVGDNGKHQYTFKSHLGNEHSISDFKISDNLVNIWNLKSVKVFDADGNDITAKGKLEMDLSDSAFTWSVDSKSPSSASSYMGKDVWVTVDAELKENQNYSKYVNADGQIEIANYARLAVNDAVKENSLKVNKKSNTVVVDVPTTKASGVKYNITADGADSKKNLKVEAGEKHKYALDFSIPNDKVIESLALVDDLEDVQDVESLKVYMGGKDVTSQGSTTLDKKNEVATWEPKTLTKFYGQDVRMVVEATMKKGVDLSQYIDEKNEKAIIPNKGLLSINYAKLGNGTTPDATKLETNVVNVETGILEPNVKKTNVSNGGKESTDRQKVNFGDEHQYNLHFDVPNTIKVDTLSLKDDLDNVMDIKSVRVYDGDTDITANGTLTLNEAAESFEWIPEKVEDVVGRKIDVVVKGTVKEGVNLSGYANAKGELIANNIAQMIINKKTTIDSNNVEIELPKVENEAKKFNISVNGGRTNDEMNIEPGKEHKYETEFTVTNYEKVNSLAIEDDLADVLDLEAVKIYSGDKDVTSQGTLIIDNKKEKFTWTAKKPADFSGLKLVAKITSKLKKDATYEGFYNYKTKKITIPNVAKLTLNGGDKEKDTVKTNEVTITTPSVEAKLLKHHVRNDDVRTTETQKVNQGDDHLYEMSYTIPNVQSVKTFNLADDLENVLDLNSVKVMEGDVDVTREGKLTLDSNKESFIWKPYEPSAWIGKTLKVQAEATVKKGVDFSSYLNDDGKIFIPNVAELILNNGESPSDTIKSPKVDLELEKVENSATKYNDNGAGGKTKDTIKVPSGKDHSYIIDFTINNYKPISKLVLQDDLENVLDLKDVVVTCDGKDVTSKGTLSIDEKKEKFVWTAKDAKEFSGKKLSVKVNAQLKSDVTFENFLLEDNKVLIPNIASMIIDNDDYIKSDEVNITTPGLIAQATKWNINKKGVKVTDTMQVNDLELHTYQIDFDITNTEKYTGFLLQDDIKDVLDLLDAKIFFNEQDITNEGTLSINDADETFSWIPKEPLKYAGKQLNAVLVVQLKHSVDLTDYLQNNGKIMIPNTAQITYYNGADKPKTIDSTTVDITTPGIGNTLEKYNVAQTGAKILDRQSVDSESAQVAWEEVAKNYKYKDATINYDPETHPESDDQKNDADVDKEATTLPDEEHDKTTDLPDDDSEINSSSKTVAGYKATGDGVYLKVPERESKEESLKSDGTLANAKIGRPTTNVVQLKPEQKHQYRVGFHVRNNEEIKSLIITDNLEDVLNLEGVHVMDGDTDITNQGALSLNNEDESFSWTARNPSKYAGKDLVVHIDAKLKSNANFEDYDYEGLYDIPNVAYLHVNDEKIMSNPVVVNTVPIKTQADKYNIVNSQTTKSTVRVEKGKKHMYELDFKVQNQEKMSFLKIEDDLEDVMDLSDVKVYVKGKDVTNTGTLKVDNDDEHFTWTAHEPNDLSGQLVTVKVTSKVKKNADVTAYRNSEVPNVATIEINDDDVIETNEVKVEVFKDVVPDKSDTIDPDKSVKNTPSDDDPKKDVTPQEWEEDKETPEGLPEKIDQLVQTGAEHKTGIIATLIALLGASSAGVAYMKRRKKKTALGDTETAEEADKDKKES